MPNMGISLTEKQRTRLEFLAYEDGRSMSDIIGRLINKEFVAATGYKECKTKPAGAQNPELKPEPTA